MSKKKQKTLWAFDAETDPFVYGEPPKPFAWCAISEFGDRVLYWGDDSTQKFIDFLEGQENALFIGHNAGKFDTLFLKDAIAGAMLMVDGRILKCNVKKGVEIRDSFAILPMALAKIKTKDGNKKEIDYKKMTRDRREIYRKEITEYLVQDCVTLLSAVQDFYARAGKRRLTIASQASTELRSIYPDLPKLDDFHHAEFSQFFFGGRVQCFQKGIIHGKFNLYDVNSMYPAVMANEYHPYGTSYKIKDYTLDQIPQNNCGFFIGHADTNGCFPVRQKDGSTPYIIGQNTHIKITLHELRAALDTGQAANFVGKILIPEYTTKFDKFILPHFESRKIAKACGDEGGDLYHKLIPNSSYGRFAMSPEGRKETYYAEKGEEFVHCTINQCKCGGWHIGDVDLEAERFIYEKRVSRPWAFYEDVATGASITGAARARLMRGLHSAVNPLYCDTDSIMCETFGGKVGSELGEWKHELAFDTAAIAGKKLYTLISNKRPVKSASKGVRACPTEIYMAADGEEVDIFNAAPTMRLNGTKFQSRRIRRT